MNQSFQFNFQTPIKIFSLSLNDTYAIVKVASCAYKHIG